MKKILTALALVATGTVLGAGTAVWEWKLRPLNAEYVIYGGDLGDPYAPKRGDIRLAVYVAGTPAKEIFDSIGPDIKNANGCGTDGGGRVRERGQISCTFVPKQGYFCDFGYDLTTGRPHVASIC